MSTARRLAVRMTTQDFVTVPLMWALCAGLDTFRQRLRCAYWLARHDITSMIIQRLRQSQERSQARARAIMFPPRHDFSGVVEGAVGRVYRPQSAYWAEPVAVILSAAVFAVAITSAILG